MQRAWVALLVGSLGCGFNASHAGQDAGVVDALDAPPDAPVQTCWKFTDTSDGTDWSACTLHGIGPAMDVTADKAIDTDAATDCTVIEVDVLTDSGKDTKERAEVCAVFASSISIHAGAKLSAHGGLSLALFAPTIDVQGTIDVASHIGGQRGAASNVEGCNPSAASTLGGGGAGGTWNITGGKGGDQGGATNSGGPVGHAIAAKLLRGGCDGRRGGDGSVDGGPDTVGGAAGGAVWISTNSAIDGGSVMGGTLTLGAAAVVNASGASGIGGAAGNHGGAGGGGGGLIVLQSKLITQDTGAKIFANGGHGGGGSSMTVKGNDGTDPDSTRSTGGDGNGGEDAGAGGAGYPSSAGIGGIAGSSTSGGGGGGGGGGVIRTDTDSLLGATSFSPPYKSAVTN